MAKREKTQESKGKKKTTNNDIPRKNIENKSNITKKTETTTNQGIKTSKPKKKTPQISMNTFSLTEGSY